MWLEWRINNKSGCGMNDNNQSERTINSSKQYALQLANTKTPDSWEGFCAVRVLGNIQQGALTEEYETGGKQVRGPEVVRRGWHASIRKPKTVSFQDYFFGKSLERETEMDLFSTIWFYTPALHTLRKPISISKPSTWFLSKGSFGDFSSQYWQLARCTAIEGGATVWLAGAQLVGIDVFYLRGTAQELIYVPRSALKPFRGHASTVFSYSTPIWYIPFHRFFRNIGQSNCAVNDQPNLCAVCGEINNIDPNIRTFLGRRRSNINDVPCNGHGETERLRFPVVDIVVEAEYDDEATEREEAVAAEADRDEELWPFDGSRRDWEVDWAGWMLSSPIANPLDEESAFGPSCNPPTNYVKVLALAIAQARPHVAVVERGCRECWSWSCKYLSPFTNLLADGLPVSQNSLASDRRGARFTMRGDMRWELEREREAREAKTADGPFTYAQELFLAPYAEAFRTHMLANPGPKDALEATAKKWKNTNCPDIHSKMNQLHPYPSLWSGKTSDPDVSKLFAKDQRDDVMQEADILMKTGANSAGSYQSALKVLWDGENEDTKSKYRLVAEERAAAVDIPRNQEDFESNISGTLRDLCNGPLGPAEMVLLVSFRNAAGISTIVAEGHSEQNERSFKDFYPEWDAFRVSWDLFSNAVIPDQPFVFRTKADIIARREALASNDGPESPPNPPLPPSIPSVPVTQEVVVPPAGPASISTLVLPPGPVNSGRGGTVVPPPPVPAGPASIVLPPGPVDADAGGTPVLLPPEPAGPVSTSSVVLPPGPVDADAGGTLVPPPSGPEGPVSTSSAVLPPGPVDADAGGTPVPPPPGPADPAATSSVVLPAVNGSKAPSATVNEDGPAPAKKPSKKCKADSQLVPLGNEESSSGRKSTRTRKTVAEAAEERQKRITEAGKIPKSKPSYSYEPKSPQKNGRRN
ncbi:hypothetical protein B0H13DRAFT_1892102 [Mycena leptocephala]|nr:hypothetical protein B0H13DRAFT_1892102 [Mycena leptocephala]